MDTGDISRRRTAKRLNERIKLVATFVNNSGIAILVGAVILPYISGVPINGGWLVVPVALHGVGQLVLTFLRSED